MDKILREVKNERLKQNTKWGEQNHNLVEWIAILTEEVGEVSREAVDFHFANGEVNPHLKAGKTLQRKRLENYSERRYQRFFYYGR